MAESRTTGKGAAETIDSTRAGLTGPPVDVLHVGSLVDRYIIVERVGAGAMGVVYSAFDPKLDRKVALKLLRRRPDSADQVLRQERLVREAKAIAKLSHANIVGIFDVGVHQGEVLLAMEYLSGGTLRRWISAEKRHWRDVIRKFSEVARGLDAAHAAGLIHRDFKSDNVLLDGSGVPKIVDFGLVRLADSTDADIVLDGTDDDIEPQSDPGFEPLTRTGALLGTPGYMAPEQFLGKPTDARSDQFAFCASLYHALYGERPFPGEIVSEIADAVTKGRVKPAPAGSAIPGWIRKVLLRGLATEPAQRYPSMSSLLHALATDPVARRRRLIAVAAGIAAVSAIVVGVQRRAEHRRSEFERAINARVAEGDKAFEQAQVLKNRVQQLRRQSFAKFDGREREGGERLWTEVRSVSTALDTELARAQAALDSALAMDQSRAETRHRLGDVVFERAELAEMEFRRDGLARHLAALETIDTTGEQRRRWQQAGTLSVRTEPSNAQIRIEKFESEGDERITARPGPTLSSPVSGHALAPGSYRLAIEMVGRGVTYFPFVVKRGEPVSVDIALPSQTEIPDGFVYVPAGRFLYGDHDDEWRLAFLNAVPIHERKLHAFLIKRHETTFGEWIAFLDSLPPKERASRSPASKAVQSMGMVAVTEPRDGEWKVQLNISNRRLEATLGQKIVYPGRQGSGAEQDWLKMPVVGVSVSDVRSYLAWLSATGKVPGARLCTDTEWERAARGADERVYPGSMLRLAATDANVDATYGRVTGAYGPDEVGRHTASRSPFGVEDMAGNVWEFVASDDAPDSFVVRGGCYYVRVQDARSTNREPIEVEFRGHMSGVRVCADWPSKPKESVKP